VFVADVPAAIELLRGLVEPGDVVLVKASRSIGLEAVADALLEVQQQPRGEDPA
jgi:UDP-N-acetylmuramoyl-tripeptide--D-alanyl-D-alanine ligase